MSTEKYIRNQTLGYSIMLLIGMVSIMIAYGLHFQANVMIGIAIGFTPVGLGGLLIMFYSRNNPAVNRSIEIESDERNEFIRNKSASTAFWITYWYVFVLTMFSNFIKFEPYQLGVLILIFMGILYFLVLFINNSKY